MARLFVAMLVKPNPLLEQTLGELGRLGRAVRPVRADDLHVTLRFLGEVRPSRVAAVIDATKAAVSGAGRQVCVFSGLGVFSDARRPRVVHVGVGDGGLLGRVAGRLEDELVARGFEREPRTFCAHLTLARIKGRAPRELPVFLERHGQTVFARRDVRWIAVVQSTLTPGGPVYAVVEAVKLG